MSRPQTSPARIAEKHVANHHGPMGFYFEELQVGQRFESHGRTITEADVVNFAGLSGDFNPIHVDRVAGAQSVFGQRVVPGVLGIAIFTGLIDSLAIFRGTLIAVLGMEKWEFRAPIFIDDTVRVAIEIADKRLSASGSRGIVHRHITMINQRGETVQEGISVAMIQLRGRGGEQE